MEYGAIPKLDQFTDNRALNIQKVQSSKNQIKIIVQGERGTRVAIYTNDDFKVGDKVLFKGLKSKHELYHIKKIN